MGLDLNTGAISYEDFPGQNLAQMPKLITGGRVPLNVSEFMELRICSGKQDWKNNYFDLGDSFAYHPDGRVKVILDDWLLKDISLESELKNGALTPDINYYNAALGVEFTRLDLVKLGFTEIDLTPEDAKANLIWKLLARNQPLLNEYVDVMFAKMRDEFGHTEGMGIYLAPAEEVITLRMSCVSELEGRSRLSAREGLFNCHGRLVAKNI